MTHVEGGGVPAGTQLNGIYEIDERIAMGGMGEVYIGHVVQTGDKVAIKMILPEHANNELILDLFRKEASTLHGLYHEAIVRYYVFSVDPTLNRPYLAMEYAEGPALGDRVRSYPMNEGEMSVLLPRIAGGLHAAHKAGIVHRDLSPDNIILVGNDVNRAKIIDFGIAKTTSSGEGTLIGSGFAGKLKYVSPEQLGLGNGEVTAQSDIYSLGLVFAEAAIGQPLDMGGSQVEVIEKRRVVPDLSSVPAYIQPLINWMLQPDPANRPPSMEAVATWNPSTPTPVAMAPAWGGAPPAHDATQIAPGGFAGAATAPPQQAPGYPPQQPGGYPPQQTGYPQQQPSYPPQQAPSHPPQQGAAAHPRDQAVAAPEKRRRGGPLKFLSILFTGAVVAGGIAAFVILQNNDLNNGTGDPKDGTNGGIADADGTDDNTAGVDDDDRDDDRADGDDGKDGDDDTTIASSDTSTTDDDDVSTTDSTDPGEPKTPDAPTLAGGDGTADTGIKTPGETTDPSVADADKAPDDVTADKDDPKTPDAASGDTGSDSDAADSADNGDKDKDTNTGTGTDTGTDTDTDTAAVKDTDSDGTNDTDTSIVEPTITTTVPGDISPGADTDMASVPTTIGSDTSPVRPGGGTPSSLTDGSATGVGLIPIPVGGDSSAPDSGKPPTTTSLTTPGATDDASATVLGTGGDATRPGSDISAPTLSGGDDIKDPSLSTKPLTDGTDPADDLAEPTVATSLPTSLSAPTGAEAGATVKSGDDDDLALPFTGNGKDSGTGGSLTPTKPTTSGSDNTALAAIAKPKNLPPTISDRAPDTLTASQGKPMKVRLGSFFDEDGAINLELKIQGDVPNGLAIRMVTGGIAEISGVPAEYGDYTLKVAAVDSEGLLSDSITVALSVERPIENRNVRDYILGYEGGECFHSRPVQLGPDLAKIEVFASKAHIPQVLTFDKEFKRDQGFEASIVMRPISLEQCPIVGVLDQVGPEALDNSIVIRLIKDNLVAGDELAGKIVGGRGARLFLFDDLAGITDLTRFIREAGGEIGFNVKIRGGDGPQILIAARPRDGSGIAPDATLNQLLAAAQQGTASLALAFFVLK